MNNARTFLETTEDIFSSLDSFIDTFLNEYSYNEREQIYLTSKVRHLSDDTVESYRSFIKQIQTTCSNGLEQKDVPVDEHIIRAKTLISKNQNTIAEIAGLLENRSEHFFGDDMDELKEWMECYLKRHN
ncbi:MAG TPA: hypothetical protein VNJ08_13140 [Bacteriovoracaceae bacterium]|nr:hypothetical protein [Bacteriovoracaceae bacterium]